MDNNQVPNNDQLQEVNNPYGTFQPPPAKIKHSGPGIASLIVGILSLVLYIAVLALSPAAAAEILENPDPEAMLNNFYVIVIGLLILASLGLNIIGVILSIIGLALKNRKKAFPLVGLILNGLILLIVIGFFSMTVMV